MIGIHINIHNQHLYSNSNVIFNVITKNIRPFEIVPICKTERFCNI